MSRLKTALLVALCLASSLLQAQQSKSDMQVRVNYMNVCSPSDADKQEIVSALQRIPGNPRFGPEFEIARGRSAAPDAPLASWVRLRREFPSDGPLTNAQYSVSLDSKGIIETVVFRWREPKDVMQVSIEDSVPPAATPASVVASDTPASRIRIERFGKPSLGLARCPQADQSSYETVFATATQVMGRYRAALGVRQSVPAELARLDAVSAHPVPARKQTKK